MLQFIFTGKACERKHFGACHILAKHYYGLAHSVTAAASASFKVNLLEGAPPEAAAYLEKSLAMSERACKYSNGDSCAFLGMHWLRRGECLLLPNRAEAPVLGNTISAAEPY